MGRTPTKVSCFTFNLAFHPTIKVAMDIWIILVGVVRLSRICVRISFPTIFVLGEITLQHTNNNWMVVNKNHNEYGLASTQ